MRPWPRDPRNARGGGFLTAAHYMPATLLLILASVVVFVLGFLEDSKREDREDEQPGKTDVLYFSSQAPRDEFARLLRTMIPDSPDAGEEVSEAQMREMLASAGQLDELKARLHDPLVDIRKGQVWRLITPIFLHFGILHIAFNMMWLWQLGMLLEIRFRSLRFLALVGFVAVVSNVCQAFWSGSTAFGGMSGVVYGLFGFVWLRGKLHPSPEFALTRETVSGMLVWMVVCFTGIVGPIANAAHLMGLVAGAAAGTTNALLAGGWSVLKRRQQFRSALASSTNALHHCAVCGRTERDSPHLEFYVDGEDHQEYCRDHLPRRD